MGFTAEALSKRNEEVINNARRWAEGCKCDTLRIFDVELLAECVGINLSNTFRNNFVSSDNYKTCLSCGAWKHVLNTLNNLAKKVRTI
jgi:hypothetical protein